jgi:two-component system, chemotaxis family, chemotaxis protein CheY
MKILVAEDNIVTLRTFENILSKLGHNIVSAKNGKEAFLYLINTSDIDLIITDIEMPEMDGLTLIKKIAENQEINCIPIIISTSSADINTVCVAAKLGIKHYLVKPIDKSQLIIKLDEIMAAKKSVNFSEQPVKAFNNIDTLKSARLSQDNLNEKVMNEDHKDNEIKNIVTPQILLDLLNSAIPLGPEKVNALINKLLSLGENLNLEIINSEKTLIDRDTDRWV